MKDLEELEKKLHIEFHDKSLLKNALTHSSYSNENHGVNNERLEFLGDAVLELSTSDYLYRDQDFSEGQMTKKRAQAVCEIALRDYAISIGLPEYLFLGKGEEMNGGRERPALIADAFEAILGAIYLDQGFEVARKFILSIIIPNMNIISESIIDYKSKLQELVQSEKRTLEYRIVDEKGPQHNKEFTAIVKMDEITMGRGTGKTKKEAEQNAAKEALEKLKV